MSRGGTAHIIEEEMIKGLLYINGGLDLTIKVRGIKQITWESFKNAQASALLVDNVF